MSSTPFRPAELRVSPWPAVGWLAWREVIRFVRQKNRVLGAFAQPLLFWALFAVGFHRSFRVSEITFAHYYIPGTLLLIVLFTAIFATISIIEDRREGFLQAVLVAPVPRWSAVLGKVIGGAMLGVGEGLIFLGLALLWGIPASGWQVLAAVALLTVAALGLTSLGFVIAWRMKSTQGFHVVMNLALMPLWLLSGAFFPLPAWDVQATGAEKVLHLVMRIDPLTYTVAGLRRLLAGELAGPAAQAYWLPGMSASWIVTIAFSLVMFVWAWRVALRRVSGELL
jgi:ABC-2 type transport system permease protein